MRILHIDPDDIDNPISGGGPIRTLEIYRRLAHKHEITVLTPTFPGSTPEKIRDGIRYLRLGQKIRNHGSSHHITFFFALPAAVRRMEYDLLVEDFMPPMSATFTPLFAKAPLIASVQWFFADLLSSQYHLPFWIGERYGVKMYDNFVVLTNSMRQRIEALHSRANCRVLPNGVDDVLFDIAPHIGDFILYVGRVDFGQKGIDLLFEAYAKIPVAQRLPLVVAGPMQQQAGIERLQRELQVEVTLQGRVDSAARAQLLHDCRFVCVPSRDETYGMVIAEACAAAKPVVAFDRAPMNEVAARACELVPAFDTDAYAAAMQKLSSATDEYLLNAGLECRRWAEQFRWDPIAARQEDFYLETLERHQHART